VAITTLANFKTLTGTTGNDKRVAALISRVEADYESIRNKPFDTGTLVNIETTGLSADEDITIDLNNYCYTVKLKDGDNAKMIGYRISHYVLPSHLVNVKVVLANATSSGVDVYFTEKFPNWQEDYSVLDLDVTTSAAIATDVTPMTTIYPDGAELVAVNMIQYHLNTMTGIGKGSESLGDYSVTFKGSNEPTLGGYPASVVGNIKRFAVTL